MPGGGFAPVLDAIPARRDSARSSRSGGRARGRVKGRAKDDSRTCYFGRRFHDPSSKAAYVGLGVATGGLHLVCDEVALARIAGWERTAAAVKASAAAAAASLLLLGEGHFSPGSCEAGIPPQAATCRAPSPSPALATAPPPPALALLAVAASSPPVVAASVAVAAAPVAAATGAVAVGGSASSSTSAAANANIQLHKPPESLSGLGLGLGLGAHGHGHHSLSIGHGPSGAPLLGGGFGMPQGFTPPREPAVAAAAGGKEGWDGTSAGTAVKVRSCLLYLLLALTRSVALPRL